MLLLWDFREGDIFSKTLPRWAGECGGYLLQIFVMFSKPHRVWLLSRDGDLDRNFSPWDGGIPFFSNLLQTHLQTKITFRWRLRVIHPPGNGIWYIIYICIYICIYIDISHHQTGFFRQKIIDFWDVPLEDHLTWLLRSVFFFCPPRK